MAQVTSSGLSNKNPSQSSEQSDIDFQHKEKQSNGIHQNNKAKFNSEIFSGDTSAPD
jgi:hypothetical protein